jgi:hypothetical protein
MNSKDVTTLIQDGQWAEGIVDALIDGGGALLEDRIDDLLARYVNDQGKPLLDRHQIQGWYQYDPTPNKKYIPWIIREVAEKRMKLPQHGHELRDALLTFERLLPIPAYQGTRDLYSTDWKGLKGIVARYGEMKSKSSQEREKRQSGVKVVAKSGNLSCLRITDVQSLNNWSWKAYSAENPNWHGKAIKPGDVKDPFEDSLWCTRFPTYATTYLQSGPFNMVLKDGYPYVGLVFTKGEAQDLNNHGITTAVAEEIWPVVKDEIPKNVTLSRNAKVFENIRFLEGSVEPGTVIEGSVDLSGTRLSALPDNLKVNGSLDISGTALKNLPSGLTVTGTLKINGTGITDLPSDLRVEDMEWSPPLDWTKVKALYYRLRQEEMKVHYLQHPKLGNESPEAKEREWIKFQTSLAAFFQNDPEVDKNVRSVYRMVGGAK